jgi:sugar phosphate isomerase/epimerase
MNLMISIRGEPEQLPFLPEIVKLGAGIELGSYGLIGIRSEQDWQARFALHRALREQFGGALAIHGPFIGMEYTHIDHLIRAVVQRRMDMTFDVALKLKASRVILHAGYKREADLFQLQDAWLKQSVEFWQSEIRRWAGAGIEIVLENETEQSPDVLVQLVNAVDHPGLGLCLDVGHQHAFSNLGTLEWVRRMGQRLFHVHLHDNDGSGDKHWSLGRGTIDFEPFYAALRQQVPQATISLEVEDKMEVKMGDLRKLVARFG